MVTDWDARAERIDMNEIINESTTMHIYEIHLEKICRPPWTQCKNKILSQYQKSLKIHFEKVSKKYFKETRARLEAKEQTHVVSQGSEWKKTWKRKKNETGIRHAVRIKEQKWNAQKKESTRWKRSNAEKNEM